MGDPRVEVSLDEGVRRASSDAWPELVARAAAAALDAEGVAEAELSVCLMDDEAIAALNREWLDHDGPTDVISFPLHGSGEVPVGDVYIGVEQAERQARELGVSLQEELARLTVHGTLHVLGWDHPEGAEREASDMWRRQEAIVRELGAGGNGRA